MSSDDKPLPRPPKTPFGRQRAGQEQDPQELLSDRMAEAAAQGKLEEFLERELPDSEHARALAQMMMGMTGMAGMTPPIPAAPAEPSQRTEEGIQVPDEVRKAVQEGNVQELMGLLRQEHQKRTGDELPPQPQAQPRPAAAEDQLPPEERATMDKLMEIARTNKVSLDWVVLRALKLYIEEHTKTGRL